ncbi:MAG: HAD-IC family P-type ATPase [Candidatus Moranbacteria bacterium]|nr:HAD-IC family P-type ATPase [Candidatus Moranbacteria bacterium]
MERISENFYNKDSSEVIKYFNTSEHGFASSEAKRRLTEYGSNELPEAKRDSVYAIFFRQFKSPLIFILLSAGIIIFFTGEIVDASVVFFVLIFNAIVGTVQEGRAQNTFLALKKFIKGRAFVLRDHEETIVSDKYIVPGDIIVLREGEKVPADARVIASNALKINESALTGESLPKHKDTRPLTGEKIVLSDQGNMVFKGTVIVSGNGKAIVVATGIETFLGTIAKETLGIDADFPLKNDIRKLSRFIISFVLSIAFILLSLGILNGHPLRDIFKTIVAISVSIIPEGLPIVITLVLASGVWRMSKKNVLVKKLQAIEVLGETKILAVDKTGTVTKNELSIEKVFIDNNLFDIGGGGYLPEGEVSLHGDIVDPLNHPNLLLAGKIAALNSSASLIFHKGSRQWKVAGDPTEGAMMVFSKKIGFNHEDLLSEIPMIDELPFDYERKFHVSLHRTKPENFLAITGSPEMILSLSRREPGIDGLKKITDERKKELELVFDTLSQDGLRVIGFAYGFTTDENIDEERSMKNLVFGGFFGIKDTLRTEVRDAVQQVEASGIKVVMITGDHAVTARAIATESGIYNGGDMVLDGEEIDRLSDGELAEKIPDVSVFSRVTPKHKLRIIQAYRSSGLVVAMTGDGVNDALSLSAADIGIGMGKIGTDVAKEASDIILLDDNFGSIVHGVEEGRNIFATIKKVILYLFSTSLGEVFVLLGALLIGFPLPILAAQILWLNLVTDGFLDVALAMEPKEPKKVFFAKTALVDTLMMKRMFLMALPMAIGTLILFSQYYQDDIAKAWTISLTVLAVFQWFNAWNCRSAEKSVFSMNPFSNKFLLGATGIIIMLQVTAVYSPLFQKVLRTVPLDRDDWLMIIPVAFSIVVVEEVRKYFYRVSLRRIESEKASSAGLPYGKSE